MKDIEFITRIQVNGEKRELTKEEASELILRRVKEMLWNHGHAQTKRVYDVDSGELAEYITKPLKEHEPEDLKRYHPSRNLIRKDPEKEEIKKRSLVDRQGIPRDPKPPKGWAIVPGSVKHGKNKVTGYAYRHYILVRTGNRRD